MFYLPRNFPSAKQASSQVMYPRQAGVAMVNTVAVCIRHRFVCKA